MCERSAVKHVVRQPTAGSHTNLALTRSGCPEAVSEESDSNVVLVVFDYVLPASYPCLPLIAHPAFSQPTFEVGNKCNANAHNCLNSSDKAQRAMRNVRMHACASSVCIRVFVAAGVCVCVYVCWSHHSYAVTVWHKCSSA